MTDPRISYVCIKAGELRKTKGLTQKEAFIQANKIYREGIQRIKNEMQTL
jgi:hypothetical protein